VVCVVLVNVNTSGDAKGVGVAVGDGVGLVLGLVLGLGDPEGLGEGLGDPLGVAEGIGVGGGVGPIGAPPPGIGKLPPGAGAGNVPPPPGTGNVPPPPGTGKFPPPPGTGNVMGLAMVVTVPSHTSAGRAAVGADAPPDGAVGLGPLHATITATVAEIVPAISRTGARRSF
jgi:hypothetical protein